MLSQAHLCPLLLQALSVGTQFLHAHLTWALSLVSSAFATRSPRFSQGPVPWFEVLTSPQSITLESLRNAATPTVSPSVSRSQFLQHLAPSSPSNKTEISPGEKKNIPPESLREKQNNVSHGTQTQKKYNSAYHTRKYLDYL